MFLLKIVHEAMAAAWRGAASTIFALRVGMAGRAAPTDQLTHSALCT
jgi:hypothetical protein